jgi:RNA polymerase sigma-70 factor, ECF subfamily
MEIVSDEQLAERFTEFGDGRAMESLFRRHLGRVYNLARRYFAIREDAEEVVSETFLRCFKALQDGQFRGDALFRTWLTRIAVNVCLERLRQPRLPTLWLGEVLEPMGAGPEEKSEVWAALEKLPDDQRLAVTLCDLEGYEAKEAALIIGRTLVATKSLHYRGRRTLRDHIERARGERDGV